MSPAGLYISAYPKIIQYCNYSIQISRCVQLWCMYAGVWLVREILHSSLITIPNKHMDVILGYIEV